MGAEPIVWSEVLIPLLADIGLVIVLLTVLTVDLFTKPERQRGLGILAAAGMAVVLIIDLVVGFGAVNDPAFGQPVLGGMLRYDMLALIFRAMIISAAVIVSLISLDVPGVGRSGEFYAILISATLGMALMAAATDLIMVFLALETTSISLYILAGFLRNDKRSTEAGIKYYLFGAFTSGIMLYGLSLLYGFAGTTDIYALAGPIAEIFNGSSAGQLTIIVPLLLVLFGFGFKISAVPFHFWTPDVYEGAPSPVTAFVSTASKAASFALLIRVFAAVWPGEVTVFWTGLLAAVSVITMTVGNVLALVQKNMKRMLAYSSIAQAGYTLMGVVAMPHTELGAAAVTFYMLAYVFTNILAFSVVILVSNTTGSDDIEDFADLGRRAPYLALALVLALLSLGGIPPVGGFFGKFFLFAAAVESGYTWLAIIGVLNAIVALYYYLTVIKVMYVDPSDDERAIAVPQASVVAMMISGASILILGTIAAPWFNWALDAAGDLVAYIQ